LTAHDDEKTGAFASPPCLMHGVDQVDAQQRVDVLRWRKAERERLLKERLAIPNDVRRRHEKLIAANLEQIIGNATGLTISAYWPFRGEPDLRDLFHHFASCGGRTALPVVIGRGQPLVFRVWTPGEPLQRGVWNIPVPYGDEVIVPDVVIAPVVGFDRDCYRLGYGGGFFDRTLATLPNIPRVFGVGYSQAAVATIYPQPYDIPMNLVVTEDGVTSTP
jgi:5,10-methenyltetrahydrofolate synthetase